MSGRGFLHFSAMVLQSVETLSDEDPAANSSTPKPVTKAKAKPTPKKKGEAKTKGKATAKPKTTSKPSAKPAGSPKTVEQKATGKKGEELPSQDEEMHEEEDIIPKKKPAASKTKTMKRPAATSTKDKKNKVSVSKYIYKDTNTWGFKVNGKQVLTVT